MTRDTWGFFGGGSTPPKMAKYPGVKPLFEDAEEIVRYTKQTGINPIMHVVSVRPEVTAPYPDFPAKLTLAFREAKEAATPYMEAEEIAGQTQP